MYSSVASPVSTFEKVLRAFATGGFTYAEVVAQLEHLLAIGASPAAMLEILERLEGFEPFPEYARVEVVRRLNAAMARTAAKAAASDEAHSPDTAPDQSSNLADARGALALEQTNSRAAIEALRARCDEALRESRRYQTELSALQDLLTARDAKLTHAQDSLAERDAQLATAHSALQSEQRKSRDIDKVFAESISSRDAARLYGEQTLLESKRYQDELRVMRDTLAARDATIAQIRRSLGERDAQLAALQREHAKIVPLLEARVSAGAQLDTELNASREAAARLSAQLTRSESELNAARTEVSAMKTQLNSHLELLRSWEWRRGFDQTIYRELDARVQAAAAGRAALQTDCDRLQAQVTRLQSQLGANQTQLQKMRTPSIAAAPSRKRYPGWNPVAIARPLMVSAAFVVLAVAVWFLAQRLLAPKHAPVRSSATVPAPGTVIRDCPTCPTFVVLPAGRFKQGAAAVGGAASFEMPLHWVAIGGTLSMSTSAVTVDEFQQFISATDWDMQGCDTYDGQWTHRPENSWMSPGFSQSGTQPVTCVSWNDAEGYARWLSAKTGHQYRLPSASEWEYAARAGGETAQPWNASGAAACANANVADASAARRYPGWTVFACDDGYVFTAPVGSFKANAFGLNDMLGNVFQWTEDCWHADYVGAPIDGSARGDGDCSEHELRGGSWFSNPDYVRANYRNHFAADYRTSSVGIRLVRDIAQ